MQHDRMCITRAALTILMIWQSWRCTSGRPPHYPASSLAALLQSDFDTVIQLWLHPSPGPRRCAGLSQDLSRWAPGWCMVLMVQLHPGPATSLSYVRQTAPILLALLEIVNSRRGRLPLSAQRRPTYLQVHRGGATPPPPSPHALISGCHRPQNCRAP